MLISGVSEEEGGAGQGAKDSSEYQTADELFELMARDHSYDIHGEQSLSTEDLVILYKNIDVGTKLMSNANDLQRKTPNQHVETVVYKDDRESDDSDVSEIYSNEDLQDVFLINNERIDLLKNMSSIQNTLCHKFGDIEIQPPNLNTEYDRQFLFKDPYIKQQLKNIDIAPDCVGFETILPASLLDYICCKRLEDNYNFYMDNIIRYVQHTIDQLKRISNGDYLTDRARQKWKEVANDLTNPGPDATKVLATSVSIPLHVEGKVNGHRSTWDDIVHSEVDVRSLSKILEKKIIIEVPKLICGSYKLFSGRCADNLIISCKKDLNLDVIPDKEEKSRVDVVFQLKRSNSGHVISNINSIMILQKIPSITIPEPSGSQCQEILFDNNDDTPEEHPKIVEIDESGNEDNEKELKDWTTVSVNKGSTEEDISVKHSLSDKSGCSLANNYYLSSTSSSIADKGLLKRRVPMKTLKTETDFTLTPDELRSTIQRLSMQTPLLEESEEASVTKKKSPTRVRIKSPYENQSHSIEEKKRKKLLEIREKKRKMALSENCKISKHKYGKGAVMAQPSSSVTKLSISNKSFYNSIYGETLNHEPSVSKRTRKWQKKETDVRKDENECLKSSFIGLDKSSFDDGTTETIIQMQQNFDEEKCSTPNLSNDYATLPNYDTNVNLLSHLIASSVISEDRSDSSICEDDSSPVKTNDRHQDKFQELSKDDYHMVDLIVSQSDCNLVPANTPKVNCHSSTQQSEFDKIATPVECRKSIDKIYDLMKRLGKLDDSELSNSTRQKFISNNTENIHLVVGQRSSTIQGSDSGTSVKHHIISSNPSSFSFEKNNNPGKQIFKDKKKKDVPSAVVPKVIISSKLQKVETDRNKPDRKRNTASPSLQNSKIPDNPLKAISQLLHEFDNVQKTRHKTQRKPDQVLSDGKTVSRQGSSKKPRQEQLKDTNSASVRYSKERRYRPGQATDFPQLSHQVSYADDKHVSRNTKRNISDIIDEAKEARGEAVRGPCKPFSRINTLAQPKKSYIQAHNEEYQCKYGRNLATNRVQRSTTSTPVLEKNTGNTCTRNKRKGPETVPASSVKPASSTVPPIERITRPRRSASNSPARKRVSQLTGEPSCRQNTAPETPENLKKKMVAVESYVKSHYGPINTSQLIGHEVHKSRVPLIPNDIELASMTSSPIAEESTALGNKLHYMIDTMINTNAPCLSVLTECKESTSKLSNDGLEKLSTDSMLKTEEPKSESDYPVDIFEFEDKTIVTAVASIPKDNLLEDKVVDENIGTVDTVTYNVQPFNSATELRKLENALYQKISVGAFPKRLRIKNLTLTPKQSLQQVIVVQSGDAGSLLLKSSLSQSLSRTNDSKTDSLSASKPLTALSNTHINWGFTNIPMQIATIGYAFPTYQSFPNRSISPCQKNQYKDVSKEIPENENTDKNTCKSHKTSQCFKGIHTDTCLEQAIQANIAVSTPSVCNVKTNTLEEDEEVKIVSELLIKEKTDTAQKEISTLLKPIPAHSCEDMLEQDTASSPLDTIDHSTSLDILMGLLNEIRKITGETYNKNTDDEKEYDSQCKELEIILNNAATQESSVDNNYRDLVCASSLDKLKQIDSKTSIYSFKFLKDENYVVNLENESKKISSITCYKPQNVDKEVSVDIEKHYMDKLTDVPSCFFSVTINHSTNVSDSVIKIKSEPSTQSIYSFAEYETLYSNSVFNQVLGLPKIETITVVSNSRYENETNNLKENKNQPDLLKSNTNNQNCINGEKEDHKEKLLHGDRVNTKIKSVTVLRNSLKCSSNYISHNTCLHNEPDFEQIIKMKRGLLVTLYSILVFTVFAALSFPKVFLGDELFMERNYN